jgi:disease resistance protein RPS2
LPLLINVIAATQLGNTGGNDWGFALSGLRKYVVRPLDRLSLLKWSYHSLPDDNMKTCFLYCAMFPQDVMINIKMMVEKWVAEGLVNSIDVALIDRPSHRYVKMLVERRLFEIPISMTIENRNQHYLKSHAVVRHMATQVGEDEENCLLRAGKRLEHFPYTEIKEGCKRISLYGNNITSLPSTELICPNLVTLILTGNKGLKEVPEVFLLNLISLKVLDLSQTDIELLPRSLWQLSQLRSLNLSYTKIKELPQSVSNLNRLQFLYFVNCINLKSLPSQIGELEDLTCLDLWGCHNLKVIPPEITALSRCKIMRD